MIDSDECFFLYEPLLFLQVDAGHGYRTYGYPYGYRLHNCLKGSGWYSSNQKFAADHGFLWGRVPSCFPKTIEHPMTDVHSSCFLFYCGQFIGIAFILGLPVTDPWKILVSASREPCIYFMGCYGHTTIVQPGVVMTQSNSSRYYIRHFDNRGRKWIR